MTASNRLPDGLLIAFYGDDFTGSAASTEVTTFAGLPTLLFLDPPDQADLAALEGYRCIGVAASRGRSRRTGRAGSCRACSERSSSQRARHALQGLLDARFLAGSRIHRKSHQHRRRDFLHASGRRESKPPRLRAGQNGGQTPSPRLRSRLFGFAGAPTSSSSPLVSRAPTLQRSGRRMMVRVAPRGRVQACPSTWIARKSASRCCLAASASEVWSASRSTALRGSQPQGHALSPQCAAATSV
jgi:hypothetical protein